jgi:hypothetical protein
MDEWRTGFNRQPVGDQLRKRVQRERWPGGR